MLTAAWTRRRRLWRASRLGRYWPAGPDWSRRWQAVGFGVAALLIGGVAADRLGYDLGLSKAAQAFKVAVGIESREDETFTGCLKGAAEGAFSSAVPIAEIVAVGELMLASPPLVVMGAGLGCSLGAVKSVATEGVGWAVHTGSDMLDSLFGH